MRHETYTFPRLTRADYPLMRGWLAQPHVRAWWGDPEEEIALIEEDIDTNGHGGPTDMRLVALEGQPFAYVQDYPAHHWGAPQYAAFPAGARAVDTFLGDPAFLGRGHAGRYLRQRCAELVAEGATAVVIDPSPDNERAVRAYRRAGFAPRGILPCEDGDPVLVMEFEPAPSSW
ncbi:acetyltransferase [Rhodobacter sp. HX-7-19]|uniref:Acetyltransferase n=1 Tax=Paragemmobacter kunshanensis TaxID=2583234 RepID=A0A6M1UAD1_9RHOB|nr:GNAT family N-acetyltransferase [Rhodobacter kunshanensis]NGQ91861.1 acetyltransferase [Rhodobacter kunshanensis]